MSKWCLYKWDRLVRPIYPLNQATDNNQCCVRPIYPLNHTTNNNQRWSLSVVWFSGYMGVTRIMRSLVQPPRKGKKISITTLTCIGEPGRKVRSPADTLVILFRDRGKKYGGRGDVPVISRSKIWDQVYTQFRPKDPVFEYFEKTSSETWIMFLTMVTSGHPLAFCQRWLLSVAWFSG